MADLAVAQPRALLPLIAILVAMLFFFGRDVPTVYADFRLETGLAHCAITFNAATASFDAFSESTDCEYDTSTSFDLTTKFNLPQPDPNFAATVTFFPTAYDIKPGTDHDVGAIMGLLGSTSTLGKFDNPCDPTSRTDVSFTLMNASLDFSTANQVSARPAGQKNRLITMRQDANFTGTTDGAGSDTVIVDSTASFPGSNGLADFLLWTEVSGSTEKQVILSNTATEVTVDTAFTAAPGSGADYIIGDGLPDGVDKVPDMVAAFTDPDYISSGLDGLFGTSDDIDGPESPIIPHARYAGTADVANTAVVLQFLTFEPGALDAFEAWKPYAESLSVTGSLTAVSVDDPQSGTTTLTDTTSGKFDGETLAGRTITMGSGDANGESRLILTQDATSNEITVLNFTGTPGTDAYAIGGIPTNPHPLSQYPSYYGWASVTFLATSNPFDIKASPNPISDFCTPLDVGTILLGTTEDNGCTAPTPTNMGGSDCFLPPACNGSPLFQGVCPEQPVLPTKLGGAGISGALAPFENGSVRIISPAPNTGILGTNTHLYAAHGISQRDADGDGKENSLDPCPQNAEAWDARITTAQPSTDTDGDGIPNACDTNPGIGGANDDDGDNFTNRLDNCPVDINGDDAGGAPAGFNADSEVFLGFPADGGSRSDQIGDECDDDDLTPDGGYLVNLTFSAICMDDTVGGDGDTEDSEPATNPAPSMTGDGGNSVDTRSTWCTDTLTLLGASGLGASDQPEHLALHFGLPLNEGAGLADTPYSQPCNDEVDTDSDTTGQDGTEVDSSDDGSQPDCGDLTDPSNITKNGDIDGDGFSDALELIIGTDPRYRCSQPGHTSGDANLAGLQDAWPPDTFPGSIRNVEGQDLVAFLPALFRGPGQAGYDIRLDIFNPPGSVEGQDLVAMLPHLFQSCAPYSGP